MLVPTLHGSLLLLLNCSSAMHTPAPTSANLVATSFPLQRNLETLHHLFDVWACFLQYRTRKESHKFQRTSLTKCPEPRIVICKAREGLPRSFDACTTLASLTAISVSSSTESGMNSPVSDVFPSWLTTSHKVECDSDLHGASTLALIFGSLQSLCAHALEDVFRRDLNAYTMLRARKS